MAGKPLITRWTATLLALILVLAAVFRLAVFFYAPAFVVDVDSADYFSAAYNLAQGGDFTLPAKRAPLYPLFLAGLIASLGPDLETAVAVQHVLGLVTVLLAYFVGAVVFGRITGLIGALGTAINGSLLLMEQTIASEALFAPLLLASLLLLLVALRSHRLELFIAAGMALGVAALTRPIVQVLVPIMVGVILLQSRRWVSRVAAAGVAGLGFLLVIGPWVLRNNAVHGVPSISGGLGDSLYARTRQYDQGFTFRDLGESPNDRQQARIRRRVFELAQTHKSGLELRRILQPELHLTDVQGDAALRDAALQVIRQEPERYVRGTLGMFLYLGLGFEKTLDSIWKTRSELRFARAWPESTRFVLDSSLGSEADRSIVEAMTNVYQDYRASGLVALLFLLGTLRCLLAGRTRSGFILPMSVVIILFVYVALDGPLSRYRYPLQPLITLTAAGGLTMLIAQTRSWQLGKRLLGTRPRVVHPSTG